MKSLSDLPIRVKFLLIPAVATLLMTGMGTLIFTALKEEKVLLTQLGSIYQSKVENVSRLFSRFSTNHVKFIDLLTRSLLGEFDEGALYAEGRKNILATNAILTELTGLGESFENAADRELLLNVRQKIVDYRDQMASTVLMSSVDLNLVSRFMFDANRQYELANNALLLFNEYVRRQTQQVGADAETRLDTALVQLFAIITVAMVLVLAMSALLASTFTTDLKGIIRDLTQLAEGDANVISPVTGRRDEFGAVERAMQVFRQTLLMRDELEGELRKHRDHLEDLITERTRELRAAQDELVKRERLSTLGMLIGIVSHELRNPLGTLRASMYTLSRKLEHSPVDLERELNRMHRSIRRCTTIIEELLEYTRTAEIHKEPVEMHGFIRDVTENDIDLSGIELELSLRAAPVLEADKEKIRRVLLNLIGNACQALSASEDASRPPRLQISTDSGVDCYTITVSDNGPGIPPDVQAKIFEPLFSTRAFGVGLGLSIVKQIVEGHGGHVEVNSEVGRGTRVSLVFPLA